MVEKIFTSTIIKPMVDKFIIPKIQDFIKKHKIDECLINYEDVLESYFIRSYNKCNQMNTIIPEIEHSNLKDIYLPLTIKNFSDYKSSVNIKIDNYNKERLEKYKKILILDNAGMGKSTLMKFLFINVIDNAVGVPFFIELRHLSDDKPIIEHLFEQIEEIKDTIPKEIKMEFLKSLIQNGDCIFFFDGYDEMPLENKSKLTIKLQDFISKSDKNMFFLSSRLTDDLASFYNDFNKFNIEPLTIAEARCLLQKFDNSGENSSALIRELTNNYNFELLKEFLSNPLMVSILYFNYKYQRILPDKKYEFYDAVYENLYTRHDSRKSGRYEREKYSHLDMSDFERVLRYVAHYTFFTLKKDSFNRHELIAAIEDSKRNIIKKGYTIDFHADDFLKDILETVPFILKDGLDYKWIHKSFQEYFVAQYIYNDSDDYNDTDDKKSYLEGIYHSPNPSRYYNILDFYYDIDMVSFNKYITKNLLQDFVDYYKENTTNLTYNILKSILFSNDLMFIYDKHKNFNYDYELNLFLDEQNLKPSIVIEGFFHTSFPHIYISIYHTNYQVFINLLYNKKLDIFNNLPSDRKTSEIAFDKPSFYIHLNNIINDYEESIPYLQDMALYSAIIRQEHALNYQKCKKLLENLSDSRELPSNSIIF